MLSFTLSNCFLHFFLNIRLMFLTSLHSYGSFLLSLCPTGSWRILFLQLSLTLKNQKPRRVIHQLLYCLPVQVDHHDTRNSSETLTYFSLLPRPVVKRFLFSLAVAYVRAPSRSCRVSRKVAWLLEICPFCVYLTIQEQRALFVFRYFPEIWKQTAEL